MDWFRNLALRTVLSSALRHGLTLLGGVLVANGWVEEASWTDLVVQASPAILAQILSLMEKAVAKKKLTVALDMPAGKTEADLNKVMKKMAAVLLALGLAAPVSAQQLVQLKTSGTSGTISANGGSVVLTNTGGLAGLAIQTKDSYSGTWELQCSTDGGTTYDTDDEVLLTLVGGTTTASEVTDTVGIWQANISGCNAVRVIATAGFAATDTVVSMQAITPGGGSGGGGGGGGEVTNAGTFAVQCTAGCEGVAGGASALDDADFVDGTSSGTPIGGVAEAAAPSTVTEGDFGWAAITLNRALKTSLFNAGGTSAFGTAGTAATPTLTVQGIASMTPLAVSEAGLTELAAAINSNLVDVNIVSGAGSGGTAIADRSGTFTPNSTSFTLAGGYMDDTSPDLCTEGAPCTFRVNANRELKVVLGTGSAAIGGVTVSSIVPGVAATNLAKLEDNVAASGDVGLMMLGQVQATPAASVSADGDYGTVKLDAAGRVHVNCGVGCSGTTFVDNAAFTFGTTVVQPIAGVFDDVGSNTATENSAAVARITENKALHVNLRSAAGAELTPAVDVVEDAAETAGGTGPMVLSVRRDVAASSAGTTGDNASFNTNAQGALWTSTIDPCTSGVKLYVPINQTTGTQIITGTASNRTYVCQLSILSATAQNIALVSGTGTVCATSLGPMMGGTTAATGFNFAANGGIVIGNGAATIAKSDTDADNICILMSSTGQLSGVLSYVVAVN